MTSKREADAKTASQPGRHPLPPAGDPHPGAPHLRAGVGPFAEYRRAMRHLTIVYVLTAFAVGFALGVLFTLLEVAR